LEVVAVTVIISILAVIAYPDFSNYLSRAREVVCIGNMRSITSATHAYLADHDATWPQTPAKYNSPEWENFWSKVLEPYGVGPKTWQCPQIVAQLGHLARDADEIPKIHYTPTGFPPTKGLAYRWATQPWFIERANAHGKGSLIAFPDGAIKPLFKVLAEQGVR
jgi:Tfp pilus assembly protein PilE